MTTRNTVELPKMMTALERKNWEYLSNFLFVMLCWLLLGSFLATPGVQCNVYLMDTDTRTEGNT